MKVTFLAPLDIHSNPKDPIPEYRSKSDLKENHDIEVILHAMYMKLQLRIRGKEITAETEVAFDAMRMQIAFLVREYHKMKSGDYNFIQN